jgi:cutinase
MFQTTLKDMSAKCPDSVIVAGGYSQGAAVNHRNQIKNFPADKVKIICQPGDAVCLGTLAVLPAHLTYGVRANEGIDFLVQQIKGAQAKIKARNAKRAAEAAAKVVEKVAKALVV